ncbi:MAG: hypothetical protein D3926_21085 [Desulfobacteraceae bacterium]|nr:MAG: hypothetical protein D3926_21085 [Desulfobacteraceae bacterium]
MRLLNVDFNPAKPRHIARLHQALSIIDDRILKDTDEPKEKRFGPATSRAVKRVKRSLNLPATDKLDQRSIKRINQAVIDRALKSKSRVKKLQKDLRRAIRIAKIDIDFSAEIQRSVMGPETRRAIRMLQNKYGLRKNGRVDPDLIEKIVSINTSRPKPMRFVRQKTTAQLGKVRHPLRLNKVSGRVKDLQGALAWLGYEIDQKEYKDRRYGKTTQRAVIAFQKTHGIQVTGNVGWKTKTSINELIQSNSRMVPCEEKYRVRGRVRDDAWQGVSLAKIQVYERRFKQDLFLVSRKTLANGFYDVQYSPPLDPVTGRPKSRFQLHLRWVDDKDRPIMEKSFHVFSKVMWANFTLGGTAYKGPSFFETLEKSIKQKIGDTVIHDLEESDRSRDISWLRRETGLASEDIMKLILAHGCSHRAEDPVLSPEVFYAFIHQNMPVSLPGNLYPDRPEEWDYWIGRTIPDILDGIAFTDPRVSKDILNSAIKQNYIPRACRPMLADIVKALENMTLSHVLERPILPGECSVTTLLTHARVNRAKHRNIAGHLNVHKQFNPGFFESLQKDATITPRDISNIRRIATLGHIAGNHVPTLSCLGNLLNPRRRSGARPGIRSRIRVRSVMDFAALSLSQWQQVITDNGSQIPDWVDGDTPALKEDNFARFLESKAGELYPTIWVTAGVHRSRGHALGDVTRILEAARQVPEYRIESQPVRELAEKCTTILNENDMAALSVIQRTFRIAGTPDTAVALLEQGYYSSAQICSSGRYKVVSALMKQGLSRADAFKVYDRAECQYATAMSLLLKYRQQLQVHPDCILKFKCSPAETEALKKQIPDIETLFGPLESREVKHCESVLGPSAYLADLFRFLEAKDSINDDIAARAVLFERRPDLGKIRLNCPNTLTPMPYIDLVCEILESHVSGEGGDIEHQSTWTAEELRAEPEYIDPQAYHTLKLAHFPVYSSFNLWQEETRAFLKHLGIQRDDMMEIFEADAVHVAAEYFGISSQELPMIRISRSSVDWQKKYWSESVLGTQIPVTTFMNKAGLNYIELLSLLNTEFVNHDPPKAVIVSPADVVDPDYQRLEHMSRPKLDRANRFLRLWYKTDLEMWELDLLVMHPAVGSGNLHANFLIKLRQFDRIKRGLDLSVEQLCAFYGDMNTVRRYRTDDFATPEKNLFEAVFLSGTMDDDVRAEFEAIAASDLQGPDLEEFKGVVVSTLGVDSDAFDLLAPRTNGYLTRASLSMLYRYATLAHCLDLTVRDLLLLQELSGLTDPFSSLETTRSLLDLWGRIGQSRTSLLELEYILTQAHESPVGLRAEAYGQKIAMIREAMAGLQSRVQESEQEGGDSLELLLKMLKPFEDQTVLDTMFLILAGTWPEDQAAVTAFIETHLTGLVSDLDGTISALAYTAPISPAELITRRAYLKNELLNTISRTTVKELVAVSFGILPGQADVLLNTLVLDGPSRPLISVLLAETLFEKDADDEYVCPIYEDSLPDLYRAMRLLHKTSVLIRTLRMDTDELSWMLGNHTLVDTIDFNQLPIDPGQPSIDMDCWDRLYRLLSVKRSFAAPEEVTFFEIIEDAAASGSMAEAVHEKLCRFAGWDMEEHQELDLNSIDLTGPVTWEWLKSCYRLRYISGSGFEVLYSLARRHLENREYDNACTAREMVKSKYRDKKWLKVIEPIMDTLREKKRDALTAYMKEYSQRNRPSTVWIGGVERANPEYWVDLNDLFGWFCIDVEMGADQMTSRVKQAISACQLFVNRCFLNLEPRIQVSLPDADIENSWDQWKWMKNYRIWEANRKVFLYPENWIEPELRHDKSAFFDEFETDLLSRELTNENAEEALQRYIEKLVQVADLKVASIFHEKETATDILHVIAHTHDDPPVYYYRSFNLIYHKWTAWEKIDTEIDSEHAVPFIYNRKLYLFWILFVEKPIKIYKLPPFNTSEEGQESPDPPMMLEVHLAWSARTKDGWQAATVSKKKLIHPWQRPAFSYNIKPRFRENDSTLAIELYITTSKEFNDQSFYNQFDNTKIPFSTVRFNETYKPWHSSSFIFDGKVREIFMYGIPGYYFGPESAISQFTNSYDYVKDNFGPDASHIKRLEINAHPLALPSGMHYHYTRLRNNVEDDANASSFNVFDSEMDTMTLMQGARSPFEAVLCQQGLKPVDGRIRPLFYQDESKAFFIKQDLTFLQWAFSWFYWGEGSMYSVYPFYHPWAGIFGQEIRRGGIKGLFTRKLQTHPWLFTQRSSLNFKTRYQPASSIKLDAVDKETVDFSTSGPYSIYNWELFFHIPMLVAGRLRQNQRFEEAMIWYQYIFDPTSTKGSGTPQRFWITKPFYRANAEDYRTSRIQYIIENISAFKARLVEWRNHPFRPHVIARHRTVAYQKAIVIRYIENLIAWGDHLFRRDTMESINEAQLLYVLASDLLGKRPELIPALNIEPLTYEELISDNEQDDFGNARVEVGLENLAGLPVEFETAPESTGETIPYLESMYFGLPHNEKLLGLWDIVEDRLFKIRHSMNIKGIKRELALFAPPIDPGLLVKAAAAGIDPAAILDHISAPSPVYRFTVLAEKALEFCKEIDSLGEKLLDALEKKDMEQLGVIRSSNELQVLESMKNARRARIDEADHEIKAYEILMEINQARLDHMATLDEKIEEEKKAENWGTHVSACNIGEKVCNGLAKVAVWIASLRVGPNGPGGTPEATTETGGNQVEKVFDYGAKGFEIAAKGFKYFQEKLEKEAKSKRAKAEKELKRRVEQLSKDHGDTLRTISTIKKYMAEQALETLEQEIDAARGEKAFLETKYTHEKLYQWMVTQISGIYFQAYQLAYDMAKRAELSFQRELGNPNASFIEFGYWDSLKKGLLSASRLSYDIRRMQASFYEQHLRELEMTKHVSLNDLAPEKLMELKLTGRCFLTVGEWMFNLDYPGHYRRRIKSVAVTVECDADPFTNINCSLRLLGSCIRNTAVVGSMGYEQLEDDSRFTVFNGKGEAIATSHGMHDAGMFELRFDDDRFLPFEGEGAISEWDIQMPQANNQFDLNRVTDFILHISYTAQEGGETLSTPAMEALTARLSGEKALLFGLQTTFPLEWEQFLDPDTEGGEQVMAFSLEKDLYPFLDRNRDVRITAISVAIQGRHSGSYHIALSLPGHQVSTEVPPDGVYEGVHFKEDVFSGSAAATGDFELKIRRDSALPTDFSSLPREDLYEVYFMVDYQ